MICLRCDAPLAQPAARCVACGGRLPADPGDALTAGPAALFACLASAVLLTAAGVVASVAAAVLAPGVTRLQTGGHEARAIEGLRALARAQEAFREQDLDRDGQPDYGTLAELAGAGLLEPDLASGLREGYRFELATAEVDGEPRWMAVAGPMVEDTTGRRYFAVIPGTTVHFRWGQSIPLDAAAGRLPPDCYSTSR